MVSLQQPRNIGITNRRSSKSVVKAAASGGVPLPPLDLTEDNIQLVLADARVEACIMYILDLFISSSSLLLQTGNVEIIGV